MNPALIPTGDLARGLFRRGQIEEKSDIRYATPPEPELQSRPLAIASAVVDGVGHLYLTGDFDVAGAAAFDERVQSMGSPATLRVDASRVTFIDSTALRSLVRWHQHTEAAGGSLVLARPSEAVTRLLRLVALDSVLRVEPAGET